MEFLQKIINIINNYENDFYDSPNVTIELIKIEIELELNKLNK